MFGFAGGHVISEIPYDNYEESLLDLVHFTKMLFSGADNAGQELTFERAVEATEHGKASVDTAIAVGMGQLNVFWKACDGCLSPHYN